MFKLIALCRWPAPLQWLLRARVGIEVRRRRVTAIRLSGDDTALQPHMALPGSIKPLHGFSAVATILAAIAVLVVYTAQRFIHDSRWVAHTSTVLTQVDGIATSERTAIAAQRGYLLTGALDLRTEFWDAKAVVPHQLRALEAIADHPPVADQLKKLKPIIDQRLALATTAVDVYDRQGLPAAQTFIKTNGSREVDLQIHVLLADIRTQEMQLLDARRQKSERSANLLLGAAIGGIPLSLIMLGAVYRVLARENVERRKSEQLASAAATNFRKISGEMAALSKYASMLQSCEGTPELLAITREALTNLLPNLAGTVYLLRASRDHAEAAVTWGLHTAISGDMPLPSDCWAIRRHQLYSCDDVRSCVVCAHVEPPLENVAAATACIPLSAQGEMMGWLYLSGAGPGPLPDLDLASQAAEQFSLALANLRLQDDLRHQSIRDPLTGLYNRRYLEEALAREIARCQRRKLPLVVLMLDLDHFKAFNDHHGHPGGDTMLSSFGRLLQASCRPEDIACRFGGEEFTLILPEADKGIGLQRAATILAAAAQMVVSHQGVPLGRITASIGLAVLPEHGTTGPSLLEAADKALYQAKADGRNRASVAAQPR